MTTPHSNKMEQALAHGEEGFKIFPIRPGTKNKPLVRWVKGGPGEQATADPETIKKWWTNWPDANIGIATGPSLLLVVDVDMKEGKNGEAALMQLERQFDALPTTREARTPTGGKHLYFTVTVPVRSTVNLNNRMIGGGLDIRSEGGMVVAPGSETDKGAYTWINPEIPIADAPKWLVDLCLKKGPGTQAKSTPKKPSGKDCPLAPVVPLDDERAVEWAIQFLHHRPGAAQGEGGDHYTYVTVCGVKDQGVSRAQCLTLLLEHWNDRCEPPWSKEELKVKVDNAYAYGSEAPGSASPLAAFEPIEGEELIVNLESEESPSEAVERLAALPTLEYAQARKAEAAALGVSLTFLDKAVKEARAQHGPGPAAQGTELVFPDILPAEEPVDGSVLLTQLIAILTRYLVLPTGAAVTIVLWVMRAFAHDLFEINPRLAARSPEKQCGKTTLLEFLTMIVPRPLLSSNCTPASIFRIIEKYQPTLLVDEMDTFQDSHEELRGILNSGHTRAAATVIRLVGNDHEPRAFSTWCPMVLAAIGKLADTLEDRSLRIDLQRKKPSDTVHRFPRTGPALKALQDELAILQGQCVRWVADHLDPLSEAEPEALPELSDRANDNWYSLLSIADVIGGDWPGQARLAAVTISGEATDALTIGVQLLADIRDIFESLQVDRISSKELCEELALLEERPWATWPKGKPLTMNQLARMLGKFNVTSQTIRFPDKPTAKGYHKENFVESWERYGVQRSQDSNSYKVTTAMNTGQTPDSQKVTDGSCNLSEKDTGAMAGVECNSVTVQNQDSGTEHTQPDLLDPQGGEAEIDL